MIVLQHASFVEDGRDNDQEFKYGADRSEAEPVRIVLHDVYVDQVLRDANYFPKDGEGEIDMQGETYDEHGQDDEVAVRQARLCIFNLASQCVGCKCLHLDEWHD